MAMMPSRTSRRTQDLTPTERAVDGFYAEDGGLVDQPLTREDLADHALDTAERHRVGSAVRLGQFAAGHATGSRVANEATGVVAAPQFEQPTPSPEEYVGHHRT